MLFGRIRLFLIAIGVVPSLVLAPNTLAQESQSSNGKQAVPITEISTEGQLFDIPDSPPTQPKWIPLPAEQQQHVDQLLDYWQKSSDQIRCCTCDFTRWDYDPAFCAHRDAQTNALAA